MLSFAQFLFYLVLGNVCIPLVAYLGPVSITEYRLEPYWDRGNAPSNVIYRVLSPVLCSAIPLFCLMAFFDYRHLQLPSFRWLPVAVYWSTLLLIKLARHGRRFGIAPFAIEGTLSIAVALLNDHFVFDGFIEKGVSIFDQSSLAFQMEIALFYVAVQVVVSLSARHSYRVNRRSCVSDKTTKEPCDSTAEAGAKPYFGYGAADMSEKTLYAYIRKYGALLPRRFEDDPLLKALFFSIMSIEDYNRPSSIRLLERMTFPLGLAKTTGIMQQHGDKALTDEESVELAVGYVERMWDSFIERFARSSCATNGESPAFVFGNGWYRYDYKMLRDVSISHFSELYGDYSGARTLRAEEVMSSVVDFIERDNYRLMPSSISVAAPVFTDEASWFPHEPIYWADSSRVCTVQLPEFERGLNIEFRTESRYIDKDLVTAAIGEIRNKGWRVYGVTYIESALCILDARGPVGSEPPELNGWFVSGV